MRNSIVVLLILLALGFVIGILFQRFYPVGVLLRDLELRRFVPVKPHIPDPEDREVFREWDVANIDGEPLELFVLLGQSNMSGRGSLESPQVPQSNPNIFVINKDYRWYPAQEPLGSIDQEVDWIAQDGGTGVGPGLAFGNTLLEQDGSLRIGLIPCARGASSIKDWQPNLSQNSLYGACLRRILAARSYGSVKAILVSQGEDDTLDPELFPDRDLGAGSWAEDFSSLVGAFRRDLDDSSLPVLFTQLTHFQEERRPNWDLVKQQQNEVNLHNTIMIKTDDIPLTDGVHFETEAQIEIGRRFAEEYQRILVKIDSP